MGRNPNPGPLPVPNSAVRINPFQGFYFFRAPWGVIDSAKVSEEGCGILHPILDCHWPHGPSKRMEPASGKLAARARPGAPGARAIGVCETVRFVKRPVKRGMRWGSFRACSGSRPFEMPQ